ncbi:ARM repeat-containing protein [Sparassis latifolia]
MRERGEASGPEEGPGEGILRLDEEDAEWQGFGDSKTSTIHTQSPSDAPAISAPNSSETRYIPPHLRVRTQETPQDSETQLKLIRQLKGLLNRMTEQNIASIVDGVEEIYRDHRRHDVTSTLTTLIIDGISAHSILLDSYVVLHAAFVSSLHKLVGVDFAAYFIQNVITTYERQFTNLQDPSRTIPASNDGPSAAGADGEPLGKECSNLIVLVSELYNFQVISCVLVYDIIRGLLDGELTEFKVELLLKVTRNSGQQLRQDDPSALKSIIQIVHNKLPAQANAMSSRTRFMVETLSNLKNNKVKRDAGQSAGGEAVERMKKFLAGLSKKRHVLAHEPLRVSLEDLRSAESKGKWWLVGAAWGGDPLVEHKESQAEKDTGTAEADAPSENALLKLARKQGMNTDIRRGIFVVLMSSEDYVDACERLSQLKLTEVQQREIIRVLLHCCGNEKSYNPYYTLIGQQLCRTSHSHRITLQFCLWDFLRDLGETNVGGAEIIKNLGDESSGFDVKSVSTTRKTNIAKAYAWWIAKDCCTLAILKPVDFTSLKPQTHTFLKELLTQLFVSSQVSTPLPSSDARDFLTSRNRGALEEVFIKVTRTQALVVGLVYFMGEAFRDTGKEENGFIRWASQVARDTLRTGLDAVTSL